MIQLGSILKIADRTGVKLVQCIKVLNSRRSKIARLGEVIIVTVKRINPKKFVNVKWREQRRYLKGSIHRGLIIRTKINFRRLPGIYLRFLENSVVLVTKNVVPTSNRVYGPVLRELCVKWPSFGCVSNLII